MKQNDKIEILAHLIDAKTSEVIMTEEVSGDYTDTIQLCNE